MSVILVQVPGAHILDSYVDEAQDNLLVDALRKTDGCTTSNTCSLTIIAVLRKLCRNPNGLFWAGDTAQTISAGSSFSFNELKSFLFRYEVGGFTDLALLEITSFRK